MSFALSLLNTLCIPGLKCLTIAFYKVQVKFSLIHALPREQRATVSRPGEWDGGLYSRGTESQRPLIALARGRSPGLQHYTL